MFSLAFCMNDTSYSMTGLKNNHQVIFSQYRSFATPSVEQITEALLHDIEQFDLIGHKAHLILVPGQYQLLLIDALNVPEAEMGKALRWHLKGLSDYALDDVLIDAFIVPSQHVDIPKKAFVALTPLSLFKQKQQLFEQAFIDIEHVGIAEFAIRNMLMKIFPKKKERSAAPMIVINFDDVFQRLYLIYADQFYLIRELLMSVESEEQQKIDIATVIKEVKRSIDYCINQLYLTEPTKLFFVPTPALDQDLLNTIAAETALDIVMMDLNHYFEIPIAIPLAEQYPVFFSTTGALYYETN